MRLIDADALKRELYHVAFETDTPLQKWDSGCWLRYKLVEICINKAPTVDAIEEDEDERDFYYEDDANLEVGYDPYLGCYSDDC